MKIWLDDVRDAPKGWVRAYTSDQVINLLTRCNVTQISLDHDLGEVVHSGYDVLVWIENEVVLNGRKPPIMHIHTANPVARERMVMAVESINALYRMSSMADGDPTPILEEVCDFLQRLVGRFGAFTAPIDGKESSDFLDESMKLYTLVSRFVENSTNE